MKTLAVVHLAGTSMPVLFAGTVPDRRALVGALGTQLDAILAPTRALGVEVLFEQEIGVAKVDLYLGPIKDRSQLAAILAVIERVLGCCISSEDMAMIAPKDGLREITARELIDPGEAGTTRLKMMLWRQRAFVERSWAGMGCFFVGVSAAVPPRHAPGPRGDVHQDLLASLQAVSPVPCNLAWLREAITPDERTPHTRVGWLLAAHGANIEWLASDLLTTPLGRSRWVTHVVFRPEDQQIASAIDRRMTLLSNAMNWERSSLIDVDNHPNDD